MKPDEPAHPPRQNRSHFARIFAACLGLQALQIAFAVAARTWMADESAHQFFGFLMDEQVFFHGERFAALAWYRGGVWLLKDVFGVYDLGLLMTVFGVSLYAAWPVSLLLCWRMVRRTAPCLVLFPVLGYAVGSANVGLFSASESHFMHALYWTALLGIVTDDGTRTRRLLVIGALCAFPFTYAGTAALAIPLAAFALVQARRRGTLGSYDYAALALTACALGLGVRAYFVRSELALSVADGFALALSGTPSHVNLVLSGCALVLVAVLALPLRRVARAGLCAVIGMLAVGCATYHFAFPGNLQPDVHGHFVRGLNTLVPLVLSGLLAVHGARPAFREALRAAAPSICLLWVGQMMFLAAATWQFTRYIDYLRAYATDRVGIIRVRTPSYMEKADYSLADDDGYLFHRPLQGNTPMYAFTSVWVASPAHCLLYSDGSIDVMFAPSTLLQPEYERVTTLDGKAKLARFGLRVRVDPRRVLAQPGE